MVRFFKWYYGSARLKDKLSISYSLLVLLPILFLGLYSYGLSENSFLEQTRMSMEDAAASMRAGLDSMIGREEDNIRFLAYNTELRENLEYAQRDLTAFARAVSEDIEPVCWYFVTSDSVLDQIRIYSPYLDRNVGDFCYHAQAVGQEDWYQRSMAYYKTVWRLEGGHVYASRALLDINSSSRPIGVADLELDLEKLTEAIRQTAAEEGGVLLMDAQGEMIYRSFYVDKDLERQVEEYIHSMGPEEFTQRDRFLLSSVQEVSNGWRFYYFRDRSAVDEQLNEILMTAVMLMAVSFVLLMMLGALISAVLSKRILYLKNAAEEVSRGNFKAAMDLRYDDEIGMVNKSFDRMRQKINEMMEETYRLGMEKRRAELQALQAKINPHFLYNCLSSIKWKAIKRGEEDIADITGLLAKFYRSTLNEGRAVTTVGNELTTVISYLEIQKITHDNSFDVRLDLDEGGRDLLMPNFLLQPLVENAVVHGADAWEGEPRRARIEVIYRLEESHLVFQIRNTGPETDSGELEECLRHPKGGYGLYNIRERIRLYDNGGGCGISSQVEEDGMICFTLRLGRELRAEDVEKDVHLVKD